MYKFLHIKEKTKNILRIGLISLLISLFSPFSVEANNSESVLWLQQVVKEKKITLNVKNKPINFILTEIQKQANIDFGFSSDVNPQGMGLFTVAMSNSTVEEVLNKLFVNTKYNYRIVADKILIELRKIASTTAWGSNKQQITVSGKVVDEQNTPLAGATIGVVGTDLGTIVDMKGDFSFTMPSVGELEVSFVGYQSKTVAVNGATDNLVIKLAQDILETGEVIVTGIFSRKKESFTGSANTITRKELQRTGTQNIFQSLKNIDPSLNIFDNNTFGSDPNRMPDMQIRGSSSFPDLKGQYSSDPNLPLFILDGFETSVERVLDMDMNRIESVTILKDAAAKAIYGSKAANGVVVIETVKLKSGQLRLNYVGTMSVESPNLSSYSLCNAREKLTLEQQLGVYDAKLTDQQILLNELYYNNLREVERGVNTDWLAQPTQVGIGHKHTISLEAGDNAIRVGLDLSYNDTKGVMKGSGRENVSGTLNVDYRINKISFRNQLSLASTRSNNSPYGSFDQYAKLNPYWVAYDESGFLNKELGLSPVNTAMTFNPLYNASLNTKDQQNYLELTNNTYLEYQIIDGVKAVGRFSFTTKNDNGELFLPGSHLDFRNYSEEDAFLRGRYEQMQAKGMTVSGDINLNFNRSLGGKHIVFGNLGANIRNSKHESYLHKAVGFPNEHMDNIMFAKEYAKDSKPSGSESIDREVGFLFAGNYSYDDRYLADVSYRASASSQFGSNNRWGSFWSAGLGWNVHNEAFLKNNKTLTQLRLRATMGYTGSQNFNSYQAMLLYNYFMDDSYMGYMGAYLSGLANPNLKWQQKFDTNYGVDFTLWNKLSLKVDYYRAVTDNLLTDITTPPSLGFTSYKDNLGKILNEGFEFKLNYTVLSNSAKRNSLNIFASGAYNKNTVKSISNSLQGMNDEQNKEASKSNRPVVRYSEGQSLDAIWAVRSLGIDPASGKEIYVTKDGMLTNEWDVNDMVSCGVSQPKLQGNFGVNGEYQGFTLGVVFRVRVGGQIYNQTLIDKVENADLNSNVDNRAYYASWKGQGDNVLFKNIGVSRTPTLSTSRFVQDLNELDLSSINFGYDFYKCGFVKKIGLQRMQLTFNMNDVVKFSSVRIERGTSYPFAKYCSFTLNLNF